MDWLEMVFLGSAVLGGTLFILRMVMMIIGGLDFGDSDLPTDFDGDASSGLDMLGDLDSDLDFQGDIDHPSAMLSFKFLSLQGLTAFFMMFGLVGLAIHRARIWAIFSISGGVLAGLFTVFVIGLIFKMMSGLQSEGTMNIKNAIGQQGTVYLSIPENGSGQIRVVVQGSLKILDAISENKEEISTNNKVKVTGIADKKTLIVSKL